MIIFYILTICFIDIYGMKRTNDYCPTITSLDYLTSYSNAKNTISTIKEELSLPCYSDKDTIYIKNNLNHLKEIFSPFKKKHEYFLLSFMSDNNTERSFLENGLLSLIDEFKNLKELTEDVNDRMNSLYQKQLFEALQTANHSVLEILIRKSKYFIKNPTFQPIQSINDKYHRNQSPLYYESYVLGHCETADLESVDQCLELLLPTTNNAKIIIDHDYLMIPSYTILRRICMYTNKTVYDVLNQYIPHQNTTFLEWALKKWQIDSVYNIVNEYSTNRANINNTTLLIIKNYLLERQNTEDDEYNTLVIISLIEELNSIIDYQ